MKFMNGWVGTPCCFWAFLWDLLCHGGNLHYKPFVSSKESLVYATVDMCKRQVNLKSTFVHLPYIDRLPKILSAIPWAQVPEENVLKNFVQLLKCQKKQLLFDGNSAIFCFMSLRSSSRRQSTISPTVSGFPVSFHP